MDINGPEPLAYQAIFLYELQDLLVFGLTGQGKKLKEREDFLHVLEIAAGQFADDERVAQHFPGSRQPFKVRVPLPKMTTQTEVSTRTIFIGPPSFFLAWPSIASPFRRVSPVAGRSLWLSGLPDPVSPVLFFP